jgi:hypothetical protein
MLKYGIVDKVIKEPALDSSDYKRKVLINIEKMLLAGTDELEKSDMKYLHNDLVKRIQECGEVEKREHTYHAITKRIKSWLPHYSFSRTTTPEVSHMQIALYGAEPHFCNDEKDQDGKIVRAGCRKHFAKEEFQKNYYACPYCEKPNPIGSHDYLDLLLNSDFSTSSIRI